MSQGYLLLVPSRWIILCLIKKLHVFKKVFGKRNNFQNKCSLFSTTGKQEYNILRQETITVNIQMLENVQASSGPSPRDNAHT